MSANTWLTLDQYAGDTVLVAIVYQSIVGRCFADRSLTYHQHLADVMAEDHHRLLITDTWLMIHRYVSDTLPMLSRLTVGWSADRYETDRKTPLDRDNQLILGQYSTDSQPTSWSRVDRVSADISVDMLINTWSPKRYMIRKIFVSQCYEAQH